MSYALTAATEQLAASFPHTHATHGGDRLQSFGRRNFGGDTVSISASAARGATASEVALWEEFDLAHRSVVLRLDRALEREHALSVPGFGLLRARASVTAGRLRMSDLAARLDSTPSGVTGLVERLESAGNVTRLRDDADRRVVHAQLTPRGTATLAAAAETYDLAVRALLHERFSARDLHGLRQALHVPSTTMLTTGKDDDS